MKAVFFNKSNECKLQDGVKPDSIIYSGKIDDLNIKPTVLMQDEKTGGFYGIKSKEVQINVVDLIKSTTEDDYIMIIDNAL